MFLHNIVLSKTLEFLQCYFKELCVVSQLGYMCLCDKLPNIPQGKYEKTTEKSFWRNEALLTFLSHFQRPSMTYCWRLCFTISLQFQRVSSKANLTLAYHWLYDFSFSNQKKKQSNWGKSDREWRNNDSPWFAPFWYPWQLVLVCYKDGIHTEEDVMGKQNPSSGKWLLSRSRKSGSCTWADLFLGFFFFREIITRDTGI